LRLAANGVWRVLRRHGLTPGPSATAWSSATSHHQPHNDRSHYPSGTSRSITQVSLCGWTASASFGCPGPRAPCGRARHRRRLRLRLGNVAGHPAQPLGPLDQPARSAGGRRPGQPRLAAQAGHDRQRQEFRSATFQATIAKLKARQAIIRAGQPQTNGCVERVQQTILDECWKPAFARYLIPQSRPGCRSKRSALSAATTPSGAHTGRWTRGRTPDAVLGKAKPWHKNR
jgi:hypothetical protein